ncbi:MAG: hypothetical protein WDM84_01410 [Bauldia sp.]
MTINDDVPDIGINPGTGEDYVPADETVTPSRPSRASRAEAGGPAPRRSRVSRSRADGGPFDDASFAPPEPEDDEVSDEPDEDEHDDGETRAIERRERLAELVHLNGYGLPLAIAAVAIAVGVVLGVRFNRRR